MQWLVTMCSMCRQFFAATADKLHFLRSHCIQGANYQASHLDQASKGAGPHPGQVIPVQHLLKDSGPHGGV